MITPGNLTGRPPMGQKAPRLAKGTVSGRKHMARVAGLPCVCCGCWPVEVHHCISGRFGQRRASDMETIPLCPRHHRIGPDSIHENKALWETLFGLDTDYLPVVADMLAGEFNSPWRRA